MSRLYCVLFVAFFLYPPISLACTHGTEWEFGRYYMPRSLVGQDGLTYRSGREIDLFTLGAIRSDREEETLLCMVGIVVGIVVIGFGSVYLKHRRFENEMAPVRRLLAEAKKCQQEGKWEEVRELLSTYDAWVARKRHRK